MVQFLRPVQTGATQVGQRDPYFRPLLDNRESQALGQLAQAYGQLRQATGSMADSYGALGQRFNQLSSAILQAQEAQLQDQQRQRELALQEKRLEVQEQQNAFALQNARRSAQLELLQQEDAAIRDKLDAMDAQFKLEANGTQNAQVLAGAVSPLFGFPTVSTDMAQGGAVNLGANVDDATMNNITRAGRLSGVNYTITPTTVNARTQLSGVDGLDTDVDLTSNNPSNAPAIADTDKMQQVFGTRTPNFTTLEEGISYLGFWAQETGVLEKTAGDAALAWFNLTSEREGGEDYQAFLQTMERFGLQRSAPLNNPLSIIQFTQAATAAHMGDLNADKLYAAHGDNIPALFQQGVVANRQGRTIKAKSGQAEIFSGSREDYELQEGQTRISLDFNSSPGASGALVVLPPSATNEQRAQAKAYVDAVQKLMRDNGYEGYTLSQGDGIAISGGKQRGLSNTIHTEPFFAQDERAVEIFADPNVQRAYANIVLRTLGGIDGAVIMAPHEAADGGAVMTMGGKQVSEREFALSTLIPLMQEMQASGIANNEYNITADDGTRPLVMDGSDPAGNVAIQALLGFDVPVNGGEANDTLSVGLSNNELAEAAQFLGLPEKYATWAGRRGGALEPVGAVQAASAQLRKELSMFRELLENETGGEIDEGTFRSLPQVRAAYQRFYDSYNTATSNMLKAAQEDEKRRIKEELDFNDDARLVDQINRADPSSLNREISLHPDGAVGYIKDVIADSVGMTVNQIDLAIDGNWQQLESWKAFSNVMSESYTNSVDRNRINSINTEIITRSELGETTPQVLLRQPAADRELYILDLITQVEGLTGSADSNLLSGAAFQRYVDNTDKLGSLITDTTMLTFLQNTKDEDGNVLLDLANKAFRAAQDQMQRSAVANANQAQDDALLLDPAPLPFAIEQVEIGEDNQLTTRTVTSMRPYQAAREQQLLQAVNAGMATLSDPNSSDEAQANARTSMVQALELAEAQQISRHPGAKGLGTMLLSRITVDPLQPVDRNQVGEYNMIVGLALDAGVDLFDTFAGDPLAAMAATKAREEGIAPFQAAMEIDNMLVASLDSTAAQYVAGMAIPGVPQQLSDIVKLDVLMRVADENLAGASADVQSKINAIAEEVVNKNLRTRTINVGAIEATRYGSGELDVRFVDRDSNAFLNMLSSTNAEIFGGTSDPAISVSRAFAAVMVDMYGPILEEAGQSRAVFDTINNMVVGPSEAYVAAGSDTLAPALNLVEGSAGSAPGTVGFSGYQVESAPGLRGTILTPDGEVPGFRIDNPVSFDREYTTTLQAEVTMQDGQSFVIDLDPTVMLPAMGKNALFDRRNVPERMQGKEQPTTRIGKFLEPFADIVQGRVGGQSTQIDRFSEGATVESDAVLTYMIPESVITKSLPGHVKARGDITNVEFGYSYALGSQNAAFSVSMDTVTSALQFNQTQRWSPAQ